MTDCGFLNLLANGEICEGDTIHDRQHPHDLFMELAADYDRPLRGIAALADLCRTVGRAGARSGGFPHRVSAMSNPVAPISHHWLDSSHITFGLITTGVYGERWKAEMSLFNGREPDDESRQPRPRRRSTRSRAAISLLPTARLAVQVSAAHLQRSGSGVCAAAAERPRVAHRVRHLSPDGRRGRLGDDAGVRCQRGS